MSIYTSTKVLPYVYKCIHKESGKIYIGSRTSSKQKLPPHLDLPKYQTSSKVVKPNFDEYEWYIVAEFFNPDDAYDFEQELIHKQWKMDRTHSLNKICFYGKKNLNNISVSHSEKTKRKMKENHWSAKGIIAWNKGKKFTNRVRNGKLYNFVSAEGILTMNIDTRKFCRVYNLPYNQASHDFKIKTNFKGFIRLNQF